MVDPVRRCAYNLRIASRSATKPPVRAPLRDYSNAFVEKHGVFGEDFRQF